jgi:hypothetical protein
VKAAWLKLIWENTQKEEETMPVVQEVKREWRKKTMEIAKKERAEEGRKWDKVEEGANGAAVVVFFTW